MPLPLTRDVVLQIRELLERNLEVLEIARRLHVSVSAIREVMHR
jgi:hypothetical protein